MIDTASIRTFDDFYLQFAKLKPHDKKHIMMCLANRQRTLQKEMDLSRRQANSSPAFPPDMGQAFSNYNLCEMK